MPIDPNPLTLSELVRRAAAIVDPPGEDPAVEEFAVRFEDADVPVFVAQPAAAPRLTVLMFGAIWSVTPHIEDLCQQLARAGFGAVAPCLFRGTGIPARAAPPEVLAQTFVDFDDRRCVQITLDTYQRLLAARRPAAAPAP